MEVLIWQLFVVAAVAGAFFAGGKTVAAVVAAVWTLWTVVAVHTAPLTGLQLMSAWLTWFVCARLQIGSASSQSKAEHPVKTGKPADRAIVGRQHLQELQEAIRNAKHQICVLSGWIRPSVVDEDLCGLLAAAMKRGASIYIGYGYSNRDGRHKHDGESLKARDRLTELAETARNESWSGRLFLKEFSTHEKILTKDDEYVIYSSNNWLSNRTFYNMERGIKVVDRTMARAESERIKRAIAS